MFNWARVQPQKGSDETILASMGCTWWFRTDLLCKAFHPRFPLMVPPPTSLSFLSSKSPLSSPFVVSHAPSPSFISPVRFLLLSQSPTHREAFLENLGVSGPPWSMSSFCHRHFQNSPSLSVIIFPTLSDLRVALVNCECPLLDLHHSLCRCNCCTLVCAPCGAAEFFSASTPLLLSRMYFHPPPPQKKERKDTYSCHFWIALCTHVCVHVRGLSAFCPWTRGIVSVPIHVL